MVDIQSLMERVEGDQGLLDGMIEAFLQDCSSNLESVLSAIKREDFRGLAVAAHALKGSVANFATRGAFETARNLEAFAQQGDFESARAQYPRLSQQLSQICEELTALARTP